MKEKLCSAQWFEEMLRLTGGGPQYRHVDAAQLIKHAFGLGNQPNGTDVTLVYLYWEPLDAALSPLFARHRAEIDTFAERVAGGSPRFEAMGYAELWKAWGRRPVT